MFFHKTPRVKDSLGVEVEFAHYDAIHMVLVNLFSGQLEPFPKLLPSAKGNMPPLRKEQKVSLLI